MPADRSCKTAKDSRGETVRVGDRVTAISIYDGSQMSTGTVVDFPTRRRRYHRPDGRTSGSDLSAPLASSGEQDDQGYPVATSTSATNGRTSKHDANNSDRSPQRQLT